MTDPKTRDHKLVILMPVYNDWKAFALLLPSLERELEANGLRAEILMVDDGSTTSPPPSLGHTPFSAIESIDILSLRRNIGHQRAIFKRKLICQTGRDPAHLQFVPAIDAPLHR